MPAPHRPARATLAPLLIAAALSGGCLRDADVQAEARALTHGGEPARGHALIQQYGCGSCHEIPGVRGANGSVGPSLATMRQRSFVGGVLPHTPENLLRWIQDPPKVDSLTAMPNLGVSERDARHIAAYLYALDH
jgi:cytochrome c2